MASRYWVGGAGTWDTTTTTHWAATSGGAAGVSAPAFGDNVFLDGNSGTGIINIASSGRCLDLDCTGYTGSLTLGSGAALSVNGSMTLVAGMTFTVNAAALLQIDGGPGSFNLNTAGKTIAGTVKIRGSATFTLQSAMVITGGLEFTNSCTLITNGFALTLPTFTNTSTPAAINISSSIVTVTGNWNIDPATTFTGTGSTINMTGSAKTFAGAGFTYGTVNFTGSAPVITGANTFGTLTATTTAIKTDSITFPAGSTTTISTQLTLTGNSAANRQLVKSSTVGTAATIANSGTTTVSYADFQDITGSGTAWNISAATGGSGDAGGNSGITFTTGTNLYWFKDTGNWSNSALWFLATNGGGGAAGRCPLPQDIGVFDANSFSTTAKIVTQDMPRIGGYDFSAATNTPTLTLSTAHTFYNNITLTSSMTFSGTSAATFGARANSTFTSNGKTFASPISVAGVSKSLTFSDNFVSTNTLTLTSGTLDAGNHNVQSTTFTGTGTATRTLTMGSGTWTVTGTGTVWAWNNTSSTLNYNTSTLVVSNTSASTKTLTMGAGSTYYNVQVNGAASNGAVSITSTGGLTLNNLVLQPDSSVKFTSGAGNPLTLNTNPTWTGTSGHLIVIQSPSAGSAMFLNCASGTVSCDYLSLKDSTAQGGASFFAGANSTNVSGNTGWTFSAPVTGGTGASSGTATATGVGAADKEATGASSGSSTVTGSGASTAEGTGVAAGTSSVTGVGDSTSTAGGTGSSAGAGSATGAGASTAAGAGSSSGSAGVSGVGAENAAGSGSAGGSGTATGSGSSIVAGTGSAAGTSTAIGVSGISIAPTEEHSIFGGSTPRRHYIPGPLLEHNTDPLDKHEPSIAAEAIRKIRPKKTKAADIPAPVEIELAPENIVIAAQANYAHEYALLLMMAASV